MKVFIFLIVLWVNQSFADIGFVNVTQSEFKSIIEEFGAGFTHTSVSGASSLGQVFGFEVGLIAGLSKSETINQIANELEPGSDAEELPHAGVLGVVTFPYGLSGELNFLPEVKSSDIDFSTGSIGIKWTFTDIWPLPVDMAIKLHRGNSELKWNQVVSSVATDVKYKQAVGGLQFQVSKKFTIFEPYLTIGSVSVKGELSSATGSVFDSSYSLSTSAEEDISGGQFMIGANINLLFIRFGLEVGKILEQQSYSAKASFYF